MKSRNSKASDGAVSIRVMVITAICSLIPLLLIAAPPGWWSTRNVLNANEANDYAPINQGQLKNLAVKAVAELNDNVPGGAGDPLDQLALTLSVTKADTNDFAPVNIGQLKAVAQPFYDRLIAAGYTSQYPWLSSTNAADDYALANIGQAKNLFGFDITYQSTGYGIPDWWEAHYFGDKSNWLSGTATAPAGNGATILEDYNQENDPTDYYSQNGGYVTPTLTIVSGTNQTGAPGEFLADPLVVRATGTSGQPLVNAPVTFYVSQGTGQVAPDNSGIWPANEQFQVRTGADGNAQIYFQQPYKASFTSAITACAGNVESDFTSTTFADNNPPAAPGNVIATVQGDGSVLVTWQDNSDNAASFAIQESTDGGNTWQPLATVDGSTTSYLATGIPLGTNAMFSAAAINSAGSSSANTQSPGTSTGIPIPVPQYVVIDLGANFVPSAINNSGVVAGNPPKVWRAGSLTALPTTNANGIVNSVVGINDSGVIVGNMLINRPPPAGFNHEISATGCYWDTSSDPPSVKNLGENTSSQWLLVTAVSNSGCIVGYDGQFAYQFDTANPHQSQRLHVKDSSGNTLAGQESSKWPCAAGSSSSLLWCDYCNVADNSGVWVSGPVINGVVYPTYPTLMPYAINNNGVAVGADGNHAKLIQKSLATDSPIDLGSGKAWGINNYATVLTGDDGKSFVAQCPQIVGEDGGGNPTLWAPVLYQDPKPLKYQPNALQDLIPQDGAWSIDGVTVINDSGCIAGIAYDNKAADGVLHGVLLFPIQFSLLNGAQSGPDGLYLADGSRPTKISATKPDNPAEGNFLKFNANLDILGVDTPFGFGRPGDGGNCYVYSLIMTAKVPYFSSTDVTYRWKRTYRNRMVIIIKTTDQSGTYWKVRSLNNGVNFPTGFPNPEFDSPNPPGTDNTATPSSKQLLYFADSPAMSLEAFFDCNVGDYAYEETDFAYSLTITIGATDVTTGAVHVGQVMTVKKSANSAALWEAWNSPSNSNTLGTSSVPDCNITEDKIRAIVGGTIPIKIDSRTNLRNPNPSPNP